MYRELEFKITALDKAVIKLILKKFYEKKRSQSNKIVLIDYKSLYSFFNTAELKLVKRFNAVNPRLYGFKGPRLGIKAPSDLVPIMDQKYKIKGKVKKISTQYLSQAVHIAYQKLNKSIKEKLGKNLLIESGYRSPAYQIFTFLYHLQLYKFDFTRAIKTVALPGYSEHGDPQTQAVDFLTANGVPTEEAHLKFVNTDEYKWLLKNANKFGFYESYRENNNIGIIFEPWHWHFEQNRL